MSSRIAAPFPGCVFWNMRFLSVYVPEAWEAKIRNIKRMLKSNEVVALSETHVNDVHGNLLILEMHGFIFHPMYKDLYNMIL